MENNILGKRLSSRWSVNAQVLYEARVNRNLTQEEVGALCGWSKGFQCKLENGYKDYITDQQVRHICRVFPELKVMEKETASFKNG